MALVITVIKKEVSLQQDKLWNIILNMICTDAAVEVINQDFSTRYRTGDDIDDKTAGLFADMQAVIDEYNAEQVVFDHAKMDTLVTYLNSNLAG